jgi:hypothetical protein
MEFSFLVFISTVVSINKNFKHLKRPYWSKHVTCYMQKLLKCVTFKKLYRRNVARKMVLPVTLCNKYKTSCIKYTVRLRSNAFCEGAVYF